MTTTIEPMLPEKNDPSTVKSSNVLGQIVATISASLLALSSGTTLSWSAPCLPELENVNSTTTFHISQEEASWVGSLLAIGALISALPAGYCADKFGRKNSLLFLVIPFCISWILIIKSTNVWMLYVGRLLAGFGTGATCVLSPIYLSEIIEENLRGRLFSFFGLFLCTGILLTFVVATFAQFAMLSLILAIFPIIFGICFAFMPESPVYLIKTGKEKLARRALKFLRGKHTEVSTLVSNMKKDIDNAPQEKASLKEILNNKHYFRCLIACVIMFFFQQFSGINAVIFYTVPIFEASKSNLDAIVSSIIITLIQVLVCIFIFFIIDRQGRKAFLLQSSAVSFISLGMLGLSFHLMSMGVTFSGLTTIPLISLMVYIFSFSIGLGPMPWLVLGELLSPEIVGTISGIAVTINWTSGFIVTKTFGPMMNTLGPYITFYFYSFLNGLCVLLIYLFVPETKGRSHHEIQNSWRI